MKSKNGLTINRGVVLIAGPDNPYHAPHWHFYVVNPELGHVLDMNNNIYLMDREEMEKMLVVTDDLTSEDWWHDHAQVNQNEVYMSEICAGEMDHKFSHWRKP